MKFFLSFVTASVLFLSRFTLQPNAHPCSAALQRYSPYKASYLKESILILHDLQLCRLLLELNFPQEREAIVAALSFLSDVCAQVAERKRRERFIVICYYCGSGLG